MALWKITPTEKKSCVESTYYVKGDMTITAECGYRLGEVFIRSDEKPDYNPGDNIFDYDVEDWSFVDGCWNSYDYENMTKSEIEKAEEIISEDGKSALEEHGWEETGDSQLRIICDVAIEKVA